MMRIILIALILSLALTVAASPRNVYQIRSISETELRGMYTDALIDLCRYTDKLWHVSSFDPNAGYWGSGRSDWNNESTRAVSNMVFTSAALIKQSNALSPKDRQAYTARALAAIRYAVSTHVTGSQKCTDGKQWGNTWQSSFWAGTLGFGAWLMWDDLDADMRAGIERVVTYEADRYLKTTPPSNRFADTKAEENGWNLLSISLAANMFPAHPHAAAWEQKALEYMMNTLSTPNDMSNTTLVDGRPIKEWVHGANTHPDFTVENHNIFHPAYAVASGAFLGQAAVYYTYAHRPIPQAASHHLMDNWHMLQSIMLPWGEWSFPQGMDWELHSDSNINYLAWLATYMQDPTAAGMEKIVLQYTRAQQKIHGGGLAGPGSPLGFARDAICAERLTYAYLYHCLLKPAATEKTIQQLAPELNGVRHYSLVDVLIHRTPSKIATFSWKNGVMGVIAPVGAGNEANPYLAVPNRIGLVGSFAVAGSADGRTTTVNRTWNKSASGFETEGTITRNGGIFKQTLKVTSVGEKTVVYQDRVTAQADGTLNSESGAPIGIENDEYTGGTRTIYYEGGSISFAQATPQQTALLPGKWVNIDGRMAVISVQGSGLAYVQAQRYSSNGIFEDLLYASYSDHPRGFKTGDEIARRVVVYFTEITPEQTAELAKQIRIDGSELRFMLPEGGECRVRML